MVKKEFKVNEYITLKLEGDETIIYVIGKRFLQCKHLAFNVPIDGDQEYDTIQSRDDMERMNEMLEYFYKNPPRCIDEFEKVKYDKLDDYPTDGEELNTILNLKCKCGNDNFIVEGYYDDEDENETISDPIHLTCSKCKEKKLLFNGWIHGWNGEIGFDYDPDKENLGLVIGTYKCSKCKGESMKIIVIFSYPDDLFDEEYEDLIKKQDYFDWFIIFGICSNCNSLEDIGDWETA